jgi:hypothetical protein
MKTVLKDITGQKFHRLMVLNREKNASNNTAKWLCICECGKQVIVRGSSLRNGNTKSCGCAKGGCQIVDMAGKKFGQWTVISISDFRLKSNRSIAYWICKCDCGNERHVSGSSLRQGISRDCGCSRIENFHRITHGRSKTVEYNAWSSMIGRCYNPKCKRYEDWGGRGITVCDSWLNSFENFYADMGDKPTPTHSLDRINNDLGYSKDNCRWATRKEQRKNQRPYSQKQKVTS